MIAAGKMQAAGNDVAIARAKYLLNIRSDADNDWDDPMSTSASAIVSPHKKKKKGYYSFEDDLEHHIREAFLVLSTGTPVSFFTNPYVTDWLKDLEPAHRPIYRLKFLRLLRVIQFVLNKEISLIMMELFLKYGGDTHATPCAY